MEPITRNKASTIKLELRANRTYAGGKATGVVLTPEQRNSRCEALQKYANTLSASYRNDLETFIAEMESETSRMESQASTTATMATTVVLESTKVKLDVKREGYKTRKGVNQHTTATANLMKEWIGAAMEEQTAKLQSYQSSQSATNLARRPLRQI